MIVEQRGRRELPPVTASELAGKILAGLSTEFDELAIDKLEVRGTGVVIVAACGGERWYLRLEPLRERTERD